MRALAAAALSAAILFGCQRPSEKTMNPVTPPQKKLPSSQAGAAAQPADVDVQLTEYTIRMPEATPAGPHRFLIANGGKENHNFAIEGPGVTQKLMSDLTRGDSGEVVVTLQPGTYTIYCPVDGHRGKGMERVLVVK